MYGDVRIPSLWKGLISQTLSCCVAGMFTIDHYSTTSRDPHSLSITQTALYILFFQRGPCTVSSLLFTLYSV